MSPVLTIAARKHLITQLVAIAEDLHDLLAGAAGVGRNGFVQSGIERLAERVELGDPARSSTALSLRSIMAVPETQPFSRCVLRNRAKRSLEIVLDIDDLQEQIAVGELPGRPRAPVRCAACSWRSRPGSAEAAPDSRRARRGVARSSDSTVIGRLLDAVAGLLLVCDLRSLGLRTVV